MNEGINVVQKGGIGFVGVLQIVFIILKLCNIIAWNWWLVMLPLIIYGGLYIILIIIAIVIAVTE